MQTRTSEQAPSKQPTPSLTALTVAGAFARALEMGYGDWFGKEDLQLTNKMVAAAMQHEPAVWKRGIINTFFVIPYTWQRAFFSNLVMNGYDTHIMMRKLMIKEHIHAAIHERGITQVVFLGGGYDVRSLIAARQNPGVKFYEIDRGDTRKFKMQVLDELAADAGQQLFIENLSDGSKIVNGNLSYIHCDLSRENLEATLQEHGYDPAQKCLVIAEGLTMYLSRESMDEMMKSLMALLHDQDEIMLSFASSQGDGSKIATAARQLNSEQYRFSLNPEAVCDFTNTYGFAVAGKFNHTEFYKHAGDNDLSDFYQQNPTVHRETYYFLRRSDLVLENRQEDIAQVSDIKLIIPAKDNDPRPVMSCQIL